VVLPETDQVQAGPGQSEEVGTAVRTFVDIDHAPAGVLDDVLAPHQRDDERRIEIDAVRVSTGYVVEFVSDPAEKHAPVIVGASHAARPFR